MRQGILVTGLLCLIAIATVFLTDGLNGFSPRWPEGAGKPATSSKSVIALKAPTNTAIEARSRSSSRARMGERVADEALAAAQAFARGASQLHLDAGAGGLPLSVVPKATAGATASDGSDFGQNLQNAEASLKTANVAAANLAVALDYNAAVKWYALARDPGNAEARYGIALDFLHREPDPDFASAARWLMSAAELGHPRAQFDLAGLYVAGAGVERNYPEAFLWYTLAERGQLGDDDRALAADKLARLTGAMTPEERAEADRMVRDRAPKVAALSAVAPASAEAEAGAAPGSGPQSPEDPPPLR